ncbi:hypothetical protein [Parazoarcus communis]|uniref:Uncharacterized protein n=1 Tax=Parazoarcus communis SWub3 = DSM 12120 TaxID=1121029 RepID=A0A323UZH5_9RHOO|nr:hypothetical protein [Parazoarcus communis]NMG68694.1 hypothetical protein [Parazoarcus communis SWub3 = DSM 12120]PZA17824.1 hypothetical protein DNK49_04690 [Azoarcus communis] [Parazoarcus communis SWub3 = DSM 12120]
MHHIKREERGNFGFHLESYTERVRERMELAAHGCDRFQGGLFSPAVPANQLGTQLPSLTGEP